MVGTVAGLWIKNFINLIYPLVCLTCNEKLSPLSDMPLCVRCWNKIKLNLPPFCRVCGRHLPAKSQNQALICQHCQMSSAFFKRAYSVCIYDGIIKECIHFFKYKGKLSLVKPLAKLMIDFARSFLEMDKIDLIIAVPLHRIKQRQRQFNQAQLLAQALSRTFSKELKDKLLIKTKAGPAQVNLSQKERLINVRGTFQVNNAGYIKNRRILLVDDVFTTGTTLNECARTLREAGAKRVDALTLARSE